ncbi:MULTISPECIES: CPXCG motif-containing cysteine-rich protein [Arsukibacterium]|uniref:CPXCG motif-containing cysteine-rich protein n=1 Tax=Arsukibacterium indicum TaxID=2848612 RepID=A0ABS6MFG1_9GAMM|nr:MULTISPECIES: CPXCG motif-containing cysteine-rich protein [Arsukibacterium]MBV2127550.1 CPXCG motif-containing cysteine-rich protein [Arsukibacterium indicum]
MSILTKTISCPFCGHPVHVDVEVTDDDQDYIEDCSNCCNPIHLKVHKDIQHHSVQIFVDADDEQYY